MALQAPVPTIKQQAYQTSPMHAEHVAKFHQMRLALQGQHGVRSHGV